MKNKRLLPLLIAAIATVIVIVGSFAYLNLDPKDTTQVANMLRALPSHRWENLSSKAKSEMPYLKDQAAPAGLSLEPDKDTLKYNADTSGQKRWDATMRFTYENHYQYAMVKKEHGKWLFYGYTEDNEGNSIKPSGAARSSYFEMIQTPAEKLQGALYNLQVWAADSDTKNMASQISTVYDATKNASILVPAGISFKTDLKSYYKNPGNGLVYDRVDTVATYKDGTKIKYRVWFKNQLGPYLTDTKVLSNSTSGLKAVPSAVFATADSLPVTYSTGAKIADDLLSESKSGVGILGNPNAALIAKLEAKRDTLSNFDLQQLDELEQMDSLNPYAGTEIHAIAISFVQTSATTGTIEALMVKNPDNIDIHALDNKVDKLTVMYYEGAWRINPYSSER
jgi:hypothetical protein